MASPNQDRDVDGTYMPVDPQPQAPTYPPPSAPPPAQPVEDKPEKFSRKAPLVPVRNAAGLAVTGVAATVTSVGAVAGTGPLLMALVGVTGAVGVAAAVRPEEAKQVTRVARTVTRQGGRAAVAATRTAGKRTGTAASRKVTPASKRSPKGPVAGRLSKREARIARHAPSAKAKAKRVLDSKNRRHANHMERTAAKAAARGKGAARSASAGQTAKPSGSASGKRWALTRGGGIATGSKRPGATSSGKTRLLGGTRRPGGSTRRGTGATGTKRPGATGRPTRTSKPVTGRPSGNGGTATPTRPDPKRPQDMRGRSRTALVDWTRRQMGVAGPEHKAIRDHARAIQEERDRKKAHLAEKKLAHRAYRFRLMFALTKEARERAHADYAAILARIDATYGLGANLVGPIDQTNTKTGVAQPLGGTMSTRQKPNTSKFSIAEYINDQAAKIRGNRLDSAMDAVYFADMLPEDIQAVSNWLAAMASTVNEGPFNKTVKDSLYELADAMQRLVGAGDEVPKQVRGNHAEDIDRHENPRPDEGLWNV